MAEQVKGVTIGLETIKQLKTEIKQLKDNIQALAITGQDYSKEAEALTAKQLQLSKATDTTAGAVVGVTNSYAQLVAETNKLRKEWRSVDVGSERFKELSKQIDENNKRLKDMDKSIGDNFRNVGGYAEGFGEALKGLGDTFPSVQQGLNGVKTGITAIQANPIMGTISVVIQLIMKVVDAMKQSEEGTKALATMFGILDSAMVLVTRVLEKVGEGIAWVIEKVVDFTGKIFDNSEVVKDNISIQQQELAMAEKHREDLIKTAQLEQDISDLRAKASDKIRYSNEERLDFLKKAMDKEMELLKLSQAEAQRELELIQLKNKQTKSGSRDLEAEAQAQAKVIRTQTAYNNKLREYNAQMKEAQNALVAEQKAREKSIKGVEKMELPTFTEDIKEAEAEIAESLAAPRKAIEANIQALGIESSERMRYAQLAEGTEAQKAEAIYNIQQATLLEEMALLQQGLDNVAFFGEERIKAQERVAQIERDIAYNTAEYEKKQSDAVAKKRQSDQKMAVQVALAASQAMSGILGNIADMYDKEGEENEKATKKAKALRIAGATMDMLGGIVSAWASALNPANAGATIWGQIAMASITSATMLATGIANIAKIRQTDASGKASSGVSSSVSAPSIVQNVPMTRTLTGVAEEERINQSQRVYVVYDDIEKAGKKVEVTESEATF